MRTLTEQYRSVKEGKGPKDVFLKEAKRQFPNLVTNRATFKEASTILKQKGIISENYVDLKPINNSIERKKEGYENAFAKFLAEAEAKAEEKKVSKEVEEDLAKTYDYEDKKDPNNMIFGQIQMGYYYEMKQEKNADKTIDEIKDIVFKNLAKDSIYYTKQGQFGEDIGYTDDAPSLGPTDEPKGKHKSSGYGDLKEHSISAAGGLVTSHVFSSKNYKDFFELNEAEDDKEDTEKIKGDLDDIASKVDDIASKQMFEEDMSGAQDDIDDIMSEIEELLEKGMDKDTALDAAWKGSNLRKMLGNQADYLEAKDDEG
jgi:hypothetical protein